jgi:hypothetical protein
MEPSISVLWQDILIYGKTELADSPDPLFRRAGRRTGKPAQLGAIPGAEIQDPAPSPARIGAI